MPASRTGLAGQLGFGVESVPGEGHTPTFWLPFISESLVREIAPAESDAIFAGRLTRDVSSRSPGLDTVGGDIQLELVDAGLEVMFEHMFGKVVKTSTPPNVTRVYTPDDLEGLALTVQVGRPMVTGTVPAFNYTGSKVASWDLKGEPGEIVQLGLTFVSMEEVIDTPALGTPTYLAPTPVTAIRSNLKIAGDAVCATEWTLSGDNGFGDERRCTASFSVQEPLQMDLRAYDGSVTVEWSSMAHYEHFINGDDLTLSIECVAGLATITIDARIILDGTTPNVGGREIVPHAMPFTVVGTSDDDAIKATIVNATP